jgi:pyrophosphatase PpaX
LKATGIWDFFDVIITPESTSKHKPDPEPVLAALKELACSSADALMIGDTSFDISCGAGAMVDTALVSWSMHDPATLPIQPTYIISDLSDLLKT